MPASAPEGPAAVVADVGWVNGLAAIRSLGRNGVRALAVDHRPWALGFRSRYATPVAAPDPVADEEGFVAALARLGETLDGPVPAFATHDEHVNVLARRSADIGAVFRPCTPGWDVLEAIQRKRHQLDVAAAAGVPVPATRHPRSAAEARGAAEEVGYPVLVKPSDPVGFKRLHGRQAFRCESGAEVETAYAQAEPFEPMVQEYIPGGDEELYTLGSYLTAGGEALGIFTGRKLRQTRRHMGVCRVAEAVWVPEVAEHGLALLRALGFRGISQVEFKHDPRTGEHKLIEVNPRLWQWHGLATACGVDLTHIAYLDLLGRPPAPARMTNEGRRWAITFMTGARHAIQKPPYTDALLARDDPMPALVQLGRVARGGVRAARGRAAASMAIAGLTRRVERHG
jgi:predicted ATP-grasp superfamily ATP-dependent carboligase